MKKTFKYALFTCLISVSTLIANAQGPSDPGGDPEGVPIDGGITLLLAAGAGYGIKKIRDNWSQEEN